MTLPAPHPGPRRVVELRIHGVSGTPPESMLRTSPDQVLDESDVHQVAGDELTGFYRVRAEVRTPDPTHVLEAYNWGQLTSGTWKKSLWLVLVPFGLLNASHFMLPKFAPGSSHVARTTAMVAEALLRVLGVVMTAAFTLGFAATLIDLVGWQWTALPSASAGTAGPRSADPRGWLAAGMLIAGLLPMAILWFGGGRSPGAGESVAPVPPGTDRSAVAGTTEITGPEFAVGFPTIGALHRVHLAVVAALLAHLGFSVYRRDGGPGPGIGARLATDGTTACAGLLVVAVVLALCFGNPHRAGRNRQRAVQAVSWLTLGVAALAWLVAGICVLSSRAIPPMKRGPLPGLPGLCNATMVVGLGVVLLLASANAVSCICSRQSSVPRPFRRYLLGMIGTVMATIAVFTGVGFAAATVYGARYLLLRTTADGTDLTPPLLVTRIAHAWGVTSAELVLIGLVLLGMWGLQRRRFAHRVRIAHNVHPYADVDPVPDAGADGTGFAGLRHADDLTPSAIVRVATAWWLARVKYHVQWIFGVLAVFGVVLGVLTAFALSTDNGTAVWRIFFSNAATACVDGRGPAASWLVGWTVSCSRYGGPFFVAAGSAVLLGLAAGLVYLGRKSISDNSLRRSVNVVWDIIAFWPRAAHPLVPPPYTAKALDELRRRIYFHLGRCALPDYHRATGCTCARSATPPDRVVLAPHSQGSLLALAAVAGLRLAAGTAGGAPGEDPVFRPIRPAELAMVSYGSQLQFAYSRAFPAYVNYPLITACVRLFSDDAGSRWINLLRETDPIGGQVFSDVRDDTFHSRTLRTDFDPRAPQLDTRPSAAPTVTGVRISGHLEWRLLDPVPTDGQTAKRWPVLAHSDYFLDPVWPAVIARVSGD